MNEPAQIDEGPDILTAGFELTVTNAEALEEHPVLVSVKVNVEVPEATAVIIPAFVMVATEELLLTQVPPEEGKIDVVPPIHIDAGPLIVIAGFPFTVTCRFPDELQPVAAV